MNEATAYMAWYHLTQHQKVLARLVKKYPLTHPMVVAESKHITGHCAKIMR